MTTPEEPAERRDPAVEPVAVVHGLAVYRLGTGEPALLMPGPHRFQRPGLRSADALIAGVVAAGHSVVTFDPPGSGRSPRPARLGMEEMIACTDEALAAAGVRAPVAALGHSMGGFCLVAYALARPERLARLVLVGTGAGGYMGAAGALWNRGHRRFAAMASLGVLQALVPSHAPEQLLRNLVERASFVDGALARPTPVRPADWVRPRAGRADWHRIAVRLDYRSRLGEIRAPCLILCGRHDPQFALPCSQELAAGIAGARLEVFERSGHYPFLEEPAAFWRALGAFLAGEGGRPQVAVAASGGP